MTSPDGAARARVLLVEDEALIAMDLEQWLTELGFEVVGPFRRNQDALRALRDGKIDFAVLDYLLGDEDSGTIADRLKRLQVPYVFLTGCPELLLHKTRHRAPMLEKPICWRQMTDALQNLERRSLRRSARPGSCPETHPAHH